MRTVKVCDTTMRDCEHSTEFNMSVREKTEIAKQLERLGVDIIEVGADCDAAADILNALETTMFSIACYPDMIDSECIKSHLSGDKKGRINFLFSRKKSVDPKEIESSVKAVKSNGFKVQLTANALNMSSQEYRNAFIEAAESNGVDSICVYDDIGYSNPFEFFEIVSSITSMTDLPVSVKSKNDLGMAVSNVLAGVKAGAVTVECSVNGLGRRAGNAALEEVVMAIKARRDFYERDTAINTKLLFRTGKMVSTVVGLPLLGGKAIIGDKALLNFDLEIPETAKFSVIKPEDVGIIRNSLVLGKRTTESVFEERVEELGYLLSPKQLDKAYREFLKLADKKPVDDRDIEAMLAPFEAESESNFILENFVINSGSMIPSTATVILNVAGESITNVATGYGPVDAAFKAIDAISGIDVSLEDFSLHSVTSGEDALGDAVLKISYNDKILTGRGVSTDIVEASIRAYINAINKAAVVASE
ncbi:MAG: hypothetical protein GX928_04995 [Ruminococcaceae bacterium]|nr:hypothetical protein [Oscillospiraceae bacterium]